MRFMENENLQTRYRVKIDLGTRHWQVIDQYLADQVIGIHKSKQAAYIQADTEEQFWLRYRSPAEEVAQIMS